MGVREGEEGHTASAGEDEDDEEDGDAADDDADALRREVSFRRPSREDDSRLR